MIFCQFLVPFVGQHRHAFTPPWNGFDYPCPGACFLSCSIACCHCSLSWPCECSYSSQTRYATRTLSFSLRAFYAAFAPRNAIKQRTVLLAQRNGRFFCQVNLGGKNCLVVTQGKSRLQVVDDIWVVRGRSNHLVDEEVSPRQSKLPTSTRLLAIASHGGPTQ